MDNIPPRAIYNAAVSQKLLIHSHIVRVEARVARYEAGSWERKLQELDLAKWRAVCEVIDAVCNGVTVQPS
jgi:hypothetical protein